MRSVLVVFILMFAAFTVQAEGVYFSWVTDDGIFSFTDDAKRVPAKYKSSAKEMPFVEYARLTPLAEGVSETHTRELEARLSYLRTEARLSHLRTTVTVIPNSMACGVLRIRSERRDVAGGNKRFYIVENACGIIFESSYFPGPYLEVR